MTIQILSDRKIISRKLSSFVGGKMFSNTVFYSTQTLCVLQHTGGIHGLSIESIKANTFSSPLSQDEQPSGTSNSQCAANTEQIFTTIGNYQVRHNSYQELESGKYEPFLFPSSASLLIEVQDAHCFPRSFCMPALFACQSNPTSRHYFLASTEIF